MMVRFIIWFLFGWLFAFAYLWVYILFKIIYLLCKEDREFYTIQFTYFKYVMSNIFIHLDAGPHRLKITKPSEYTLQKLRENYTIYPYSKTEITIEIIKN